MKQLIVLGIICLALVGCDKKQPTAEQREIVDRLIQQNIDIPYTEPNWQMVEEKNLLKGETVEQASERSKRIYEKIHNYLLQLKTESYEKKSTWAIKSLELEVEMLDSAIKVSPGLKNEAEVSNILEKKKRWLKVLKE